MLRLLGLLFHGVRSKSRSSSQSGDGRGSGPKIASFLGGVEPDVVTLGGGPGVCEAGDGRAVAPQKVSGSTGAPDRRCRSGPPIEACVANLVRQMAAENPDWGAPRIDGELLKLGFDVSERTVSRYLPKVRPKPDAIESWKTFLRNHRPELDLPQRRESRAAGCPSPTLAR